MKRITVLIFLFGLISITSCCGVKVDASSCCCCMSGNGFTGSTAYGNASWYGKKFHGRKTASGETFNMYDLTAAHKKLPFGTKVKVTNLKNKKNVVVRINDRGPFVKGRIIDLSYAAAKKIGLDKMGVTKVKLEIISK